MQDRQERVSVSKKKKKFEPPTPPPPLSVEADRIKILHYSNKSTT
jgi:hypothetical protein